ncbi:MAG TPA: hypothetical protein VF782_14415 [Allosphingosinicella sp.]
MSALLWLHIAGGSIALAAGAVAALARKGGRLHGSAGGLFAAAMIVLGVTASILEPFRDPPGSPAGGIIVCYFVATAWVTARRRDGIAGRFERVACAFALLGAAAAFWGGFTGETTPAGPAPVFAFAALCLLAGLGDLNFILRGRLTARQRLSRHVWRICFAFFIATGSFFLGQQDALPQGLRGSALLFVPAFAPFALMAFWLVRLRFGKRFRDGPGAARAKVPLPAAS